MSIRCRSEVDPRSVRARGARSAPAPASRWPRPAPLAGLLRASTWLFIARALCSPSSRLLGAHCAPSGLLRRRGAGALPATRARFIVVRPFFICFAGGVFPAPIALRRNSSPLWPPLLFPPAAGCPCRAPAAGAAAAPEGTPLRGSRFARHSGVAPRVFFGWRGVLRAGVQSVSPRCGGPRFATLLPCPNARHLCDIFCLARGARVAPCPARGLRPCASRGGLPAAPAPLQPARRGRFS